MTEQLYRKTAEGLAYNYSSSLIVNILQFFTSVILVKFLTVGDFGTYGILMVTIGALVLVFPFSALQRFLPQYFQEGRPRLARRLVAAFVLYTAVALAFFALAVALAHFLGFAALDGGLLLVFGIAAALSVFSGLADSVLVAVLEQKLRSIARVIYSVIFFGLAYVFLSQGLAVEGVFYALAIATLALVLFTGIAAFGKVFPKESGKAKEKAGARIDSRAVLSYSAYSTLSSLGDVFLSIILDIWLVGIFLGAYYAGLYTFAAKTAQSLVILSPVAMVSVAIFPFIVKKYTETKSKEQLSYFFGLCGKLVAFFAFPMAAGLVIFSRPLISIVFTPEYLAVSSIFIVSVIAFTVSGFRVGVVMVYNTLGKPQIGLKAKALFAYNIAADVILIPAFGLYGAVFATASSAILLFAAEYFMTSRLLPLKFPKASFARSLLAMLAMSAVLLIVLPMISGILSLVWGIAAGIAAYFGVAFLAKPFSQRDRDFFAKAGIVGKFFAFFSKRA